MDIAGKSAFAMITELSKDTLFHVSFVLPADRASINTAQQSSIYILGTEENRASISVIILDSSAATLNIIHTVSVFEES